MVSGQSKQNCQPFGKILDTVGQKLMRQQESATEEHVTLRAHHLLCLLGFRGLGYSPEFTRNMTRIAARLRADPATRIRLRARPDDICAACPHLDGGCRQEGPESESRARRRDRAVLSGLGLRSGEETTWAEALLSLARVFSAGDIVRVCAPCPWLEHGYCARGLAHLIATGAPEDWSVSPDSPPASSAPRSG